MGHIDSHPPGDFCWFELATTDPSAAKTFYSSLLGWTVTDVPMGPDKVYTMFKMDGREAGAACAMREEQRAQGVPPHWLLYITVESADGTADRAPALGGKVLAPPFDVFDAGRMAVLEDPTGAVFAVWEPKAHIGTRITGVAGTFCWADLSTPDPGAAGRFYTGLFGWALDAGHDKSGYLHIKNGEQYIGGIPPAAHRNPQMPANWMLYFAVENCDASAERAEQLGATFHLRPMTIENVGRMAVLADGQGAVFAIFQAMPRG